MQSLKADERIAIDLRGLYQRYGYQPYKVGKFEAYDLYMRNKNFLTSEQILTFSDTDGRLMALKPDVTLSIVKNTKDEDTPLKVCYAENVYRVPRGAYGFKEIMQVGVECLGVVDAYAMGEVLMLAARSLAAISERYVLDVSDMGIVSGILAQEALDHAAHRELLALISEKNLHGLRERCRTLGIGARTARQLEALVTVCGPLGETLSEFEALGMPACCEEALANLRAVSGMIRAYGIDQVNLDFSVVNDMSYYNGLIFSGFIDGIPASVLSGGRYDPLMRRMGRKSQAIGFAVYLDQLERFMQTRSENDVDTLILYDAAADPQELARLAQEEVRCGRSVRVQTAGGTALRAERTVDLCGGRTKA